MGNLKPQHLHDGVQVLSAIDSVRDEICKVAVAHSSGTCTRDYLDPTHYPDEPFPPKRDWCAFYAAWVWRQANVGVYFRTSPNFASPLGICRASTDLQVAASGKLDFLLPGDIILFDYLPDPNNPKRKIRNHHAIVIAVQGRIISMVEGNAGSKPQTSPVHYAKNYDLRKNYETKAFYSVQTFKDPNVRFV